MANLTRIKNNQITDSTILANTKIVPGSIVGSLFNANLTVASDVTITGNLTVQGSSTYLTVASTNTYVNDPLIVLNNAFTGTNTYDIGLLINRGDQTTTAFIWKESNKQFELTYTSDTGTSYGAINNSGYANLKVGNITVAGVTTLADIGAGNLTLSGDLAVNGGDITTSAGTFNLLNTPTVINAFTEATDLELGHTTGTATINNPIVVGTQTSQDLYNTVATTLNFAGAATTLTVGATSGTLNLRNSNIWLPTATTIDGAVATVALLSSPTTLTFANAASTLSIGANSGTLTVRNPTVVGTETTQNLYNTVATTLNVGGAATALTIGATSGTLTLRNPTVVGTETTQNLYNTTATTVNAFGAATSLIIGSTTGAANIRNATTNILGNATIGGTITLANGAVIKDTAGNSLSFGVDAGVGQGNGSLAIGQTAGYSGQGAGAVAIGGTAGFLSQGDNTVALGTAAGNSGQGIGAVAVGYRAGTQGQLASAVAIGDSAGYLDQGAKAVAIGYFSGNDGQGADAIAIGNGAGVLDQAANTIILNATGANVNGVSAQTDSFYVAPIRNATGNVGTLQYNSTTKEVTYSLDLTLANITLTGDLAVNGGDITTTASTFNLLNDNATTVDAFKAATDLEFGATSGTLTINNPTVVGTQTTQALYNTTATTLNFAGAATTLIVGSTTGVANIRNATTNIIGNATVGGTLGVTGNATLSGTLGVTGAVTLTDDLAVNGGDITTSAGTATVFNTNATTVNAFGAATTLGIGAGTGTLTLNNATVTTPGQIVSTRAGSATTGGGQLFLNGSTSNRIDWNANGFGPPVFTTRSDGTKVVLYPALSGSSVDYAIGIDAATMWSSVPENGDSFNFKWYGAETLVANLSGTGNFTTVGDVAVNGGDITTTATTATLFNTNATSLSFAGAATTLTVGATSGTTTIRNNLTNTGNILINATAQSTDKDTGALIVEGGVGVEKNLNVGGGLSAAGNVTLTGTQQSTNSTTGAVIIDGGVGVAKNLNVGGDVVITGNLQVDGAVTTVNTATLDVEDLNITIAKGAGSSSAANGAGLTVDGASATLLYTHSTTSWDLNKTTRVTATTAATNNAEGALQVLGGAGIAGSLYARDINATVIGNVTPAAANVTTFTATGTTTLGLTTATAINNTPIGNATASSGSFTTLVSSGVTEVTNTTEAFSQGGGAFRVGGGASVAGNLWVGGNINITGSNYVLTTTSGVFYGDTNGFGAVYAGVTGYTPLPQTVLQTTGSYNGYVQNNFENLSTGTKASTDWVATAGDGSDTDHYIDMGITTVNWDGSQENSLTNAVGDNDGYLYVQGNVSTGQGGNLTIGASTPGTKQVKVIVGGNTASNITAIFTNPNTPSTTTTSGAFIVTGGVGVSGNLNANNIGITNSLSATSLTLSGDIAVNGGDITTTATTATVFNTTATTVNAFGAATTLSIGATSGTTTVNNNLTIGNGGELLTVNGSMIVEGGVYGNVTTTQFGSVYARAYGPNAYSLVQAKSNDDTTGIGMQSFSGANGLIYSNSGISFAVGATVRDLDTPTGGTIYVTISNTGIVTLGNDIVSSTTTQNVFNTVATTVNAFGAATTLTVGATTGVANIRNATTNIIGNATVGGTLGVTGNTSVLAETDSTSTDTGALTVAGGVGIAKTVHVGGNVYVNSGKRLAVGADLVSNIIYPENTAQFTTSANAYSRIAIQNLSSGTNATSEFIAIADNGTNIANYLITGIASSGFDEGIIIKANDGYTLARGGNLVLSSVSDDIKFSVSSGILVNISAANANVSILADGESNSTTTGALTVAGGVGIAKKLRVAGDTILTSNLAVNGGDLTTTAGTFNLIDTDATTVNFAGAATTIDLGATSGTLTINNPTVVGSQTTQNLYNTTATTVNFAGAATTLIIGATTGVANIRNATTNIIGNATVGGTLDVSSGTTINSTQTSDNFVVKGVNTSSLIVADSAYGAVVIGGSNATPQLGATLKINSSDSILVPVGSTADRPSNTGNIDITGMVRYSTTVNALEFYNGTAWVSAGSDSTFTIITSEQFTGNGVADTFTLSDSTTTASTMVSINGVVQIPTYSYSITVDQLVFTEVPAAGDLIDVRILTTTQTAGAEVSSGSGFNTFTPTDADGAQIFSGTSAKTLRVTAAPDGTWSYKNGTKTSYDQTVTNIASAATPVIVDSFASADYTTAKYIVQTKNGSSVESMEAVLVQDGSNAYVSTYGIVSSGSGLGTLSANIVSGNVKLYYTSTSVTNSNVKVYTTYIV